MRGTTWTALLAALVVAAMCAVGVAACDDEEPIYIEPTCEHRGERYELGETFPAGDGCNDCTCHLTEQGAAASCTLRLCIPDAVP